MQEFSPLENVHVWVVIEKRRAEDFERTKEAWSVLYMKYKMCSV